MRERRRLRGFTAGVAACACVVVAASAAVVAVQGITAHGRATTPVPSATAPTAAVAVGAVERIVTGDVAVSTAATSTVPGPRNETGARVFTRTGARAGARLDSGSVITTIDERPTVLLQSDVPFFRPLALGSSGRDVAALQTALRALGYGLAGDRAGSYGPGTARAVFFLYRDRDHEPVDASGGRVDLDSATTAAVPLGEVFAAPTAPMEAAAQCGSTGEPASDDACELRNVDGSLRLTVAESEAGSVEAGQPVRVRLDDGTDIDATVGNRVDPAATGSGEASAEPGSLDGDAEPADDGVQFLLDSGTPVGATATGTAVVVTASAPASSLTVPEIAIRRTGDASWLMTDSGAKLAVTVGLCAAGVCVVRGDGVAEGRRIRLPGVAN